MPSRRSQFPSVKSYLKRLHLVVADEALTKLQRYAREGRFADPSEYAPYADFSWRAATLELSALSASQLVHAISHALSGAPDGREGLRRASNCAYWAERLRLRLHLQILDDYQSGLRPQYLPTCFLHRTSLAIGLASAFGWHARVLDLSERALGCLLVGGYVDAGEPGAQRAGRFVLQLVAGSQGWSETTRGDLVTDVPAYANIVRTWDVEDAATLAPFLLDALDRHTHEARPNNNRQDYDFPYPVEWYVPMESLTLMHLRRQRGLDNRSLASLEHPLLATPLGQLQADTSLPADELLQGVVAQATNEIPDL